MAFFSKKDDLPRSSVPASTGAISSIVSKDMRITGEIHFTGKARIDGTIEGNIKGEHLILSESGKVFGDLELTSLICRGSVKGNIKAQDVTTHSTANLHGNLMAANLTVEPGAKLNGEITAASQQSPQQQPATPSSSTVPEEKQKGK